MAPQLGFGGWMPRPRKLRLASASKAAASSSVTCTITGCKVFGSTCFHRMCRTGADDTRQRRKHHDADRDHAVGEADTERAGDRDRQHDGRKREESVDDAA